MPTEGVWVDPQGIPVRIMGKGRWRDYEFAGGAAWQLWRQRANYDVIYFLMQGLHLALGLPVARLLGKPVVMKISGSGIISDMRQTRLGRLELRWLQRWAVRVMVLNEGMKEEAREAGFRDEQLLWMPNPVDTAEFAPVGEAGKRELRRELGVAEDATVVLFVGRLAPEKELASLLGAFERVVGEYPKALLVMVGDGPLRGDLEERARGMGGQVRWLGRQGGNEVRRWLQAGDGFALVSSREGFSCSLVEAMSVGLAPLVSDIPGNRQLVTEGETGWMAPVGDEEALAKGLRRLLGSAEERERVGRRGRLSVESLYSVEKIVAIYEKLFAEALGR